MRQERQPHQWCPSLAPVYLATSFLDQLSAELIAPGRTPVQLEELDPLRCPLGVEMTYFCGKGHPLGLEGGPGAQDAWK